MQQLQLYSKKQAAGLIALVNFLALGVILFFLYLRNYLPIHVLSLPFDDELFVRRAAINLNQELLTNLSGYNQLVKGVVYPWFLTATSYFKFNPILVVYIILIILLYILFYNLFEKKFAFFIPIALVLTLFDPSPFKSPASRVARESLYQLTILFVVTLLIVIYRQIMIPNLRKIALLALSFGCGLFLFLAQNIREERSWVFLIFLVTNVIIFLKIYMNNSRKIKVIAIALGLILLSYLSFMEILKSFHMSVYNVRLTNATTEGEFPNLLANLSSIDTGELERSYVSVPYSKRIAAYEVSPSFAELEDYLEGPGGMWVQFGCDNAQVCDDYANSFFHIALREAIKSKGYWTTQDQAQNFMFQINTEIEKACNDELLRCVTPLPLAKGLGVTKISTDQLLDSTNFLREYFRQSINGWGLIPNLQIENINFREGNYYPKIMDDSWVIWKNVITVLPKNQDVYEQKFNFKVGKTIGFIEIWNYIYSYFLKFGLLIFIVANLTILFQKVKSRRLKQLILFGNLFIFIWLSRGILLSLNSVTNLISINEYYSLPGRVFLSISISLFYVIFIIFTVNLIRKLNLKRLL